MNAGPGIGSSAFPALQMSRAESNCRFRTNLVSCQGGFVFRLTVKHLIVVALLAGFFIGRTMLGQNAASQAVRRLPSSQEVRPAPSEDFQAPTDEQIQLLRKDIRAQRKQLIAANMKLSGAEAEKFWPIYEAYIDELVAINRTKYDLIKQYAAG